MVVDKYGGVQKYEQINAEVSAEDRIIRKRPRPEYTESSFTIQRSNKVKSNRTNEFNKIDRGNYQVLHATEKKIDEQQLHPSWIAKKLLNCFQ